VAAKIAIALKPDTSFGANAKIFLWTNDANYCFVPPFPPRRFPRMENP
jgi:hypothetical protein